MQTCEFFPQFQSVVPTNQRYCTLSIVSKPRAYKSIIIYIIMAIILGVNIFIHQFLRDTHGVQRVNDVSCLTMLLLLLLLLCSKAK